MKEDEKKDMEIDGNLAEYISNKLAKVPELQVPEGKSNIEVKTIDISEEDKYKQRIITWAKENMNKAVNVYMYLYKGKDARTGKPIAVGPNVTDTVESIVEVYGITLLKD